MKTNQLKYISILGGILFFIACSTKKDTFLSRNSHALSAEYNILYNGGIALDKGIADLKSQYKDNFWERLPIERMQVNKESFLPGQSTPNPNFERAETKAIKAIQKHSMNIAGSERNPQMDEAYLMLGKARYYDQRYVPSLEAFNYILYKYPNSDKIYEAKIWREKVNIRMDNDALAVNNLRRLLKDIKFKDQIFADANAILSQAFLNLEQKDSAIAKLKLAKEFTKQKEEKARYNFILGQLYRELGYKDSAFASYQTVIAMKRKSPRQYVIQAHIKQSQMFDYKAGDTIAFLENYRKLIKDRENRPFLDVLYHQMAVFYENVDKPKIAMDYYQTSLKTKSQDSYLIASNYRNLAEIYFNKAKYVTAGKYYDSTMVQLNNRTREFKAIKKKRDNLVDVIKYEGIATRNDSIIDVFSLSDKDRVSYYENYIARLKKEEEAQKILLEKQQKEMQSQSQDNGVLEGQDSFDKVDKNGRSRNREKDNGRQNSLMPPAENNPSSAVTQNNFYFYNSSTVAFGKKEFKKNWGDRAFKENWRLSSGKADEENSEGNDTTKNDSPENSIEEKVDERHTVDFYLKQLPKNQIAVDSIARERNFAYYQLGSIYKEKFKKYSLAENRYAKLLEFHPEERLVLPSMYNLYKIYQILGDKDKELAMKERIISQYPDSRYAQIIGNTNATSVVSDDSPETSYYKLYKQFQIGDYKTVLTNVDLAINQYAGEEIIPKLELLKANTIGKLKGLEEFKKALNFVALNYPNNEEGKIAELYLANDMPKLESLKFYQAKPLSWKILYTVSGNPEDKNVKNLQDKIKKFFTDRDFAKITMSNDIYTLDKNFIVIHGMKTEEYANGIASILKEFKDYKVQDKAYIISSDNYKIVQIKKNFEEYLNTDPSQPVPNIPPVVPNNQVNQTNSSEPAVVPIPNQGNTIAPPNENDSELQMLPPQAPDDEIGTPPQEPDPVEPK